MRHAYTWDVMQQWKRSTLPLCLCQFDIFAYLSYIAILIKITGTIRSIVGGSQGITEVSYVHDLSTSLHYLNYILPHASSLQICNTFCTGVLTFTYANTFAFCILRQRMFNDHDFIFYNYVIEKLTIAVLYNNMDGQQ